MAVAFYIGRFGVRFVRRGYDVVDYHVVAIPLYARAWLAAEDHTSQTLLLAGLDGRSLGHADDGHISRRI